MKMRCFIFLVALCQLVALAQLVAGAPSAIRVGFITHPMFERKEEAVAALELAVEQLKSDGILPEGLEFTIFTRKGCTRHSGPGVAVELYKEHNVSVIFGPACTSGCEPTAKLAAYWNLPILTHIASAEGLGNKKYYPTLARTTVVSKSEAGFAAAFAIKSFGWTRVGFLQGPDKHTVLLADAIRIGLAHYGVNISYDYVIKNQTLELETSMKLMSDHARIIVLVFGLRPSDSIDALLAAQRLAMATPEYVYVIPGTSYMAHVPWETDNLQTETGIARDAFRYAITVEHDAFQPESIDKFTQRIRLYLNESHVRRGQKMYLSQLFDAMYLYGLGLNQTLDMNSSYLDGQTIQKNMRNKQFTGESGNVSMDEKGDRMPHYLIRAFNRQKEWLTMLTLERVYDRTADKYHRWDNGWNNCAMSGGSWQMAAVRHDQIVDKSWQICVFHMFPVRRKRKLEQEIFKMAWKIDQSKLIMLKKDAQTLSLRSLVSNQSFISGAQTQENHEEGLGLYNGTPVFVQKLIKKENLKFDRDHLMHLKAMKDASSRYLNQFIGMIIDQHEHVLVLWVHITSRTLHDVLFNDDWKLDLEFKMSFLSDIIKGLQFLHRSMLCCHGRLTTVTSLVDSRMVVTLSEFGLSNLFGDYKLLECVEPSTSDPHLYYHVAPEILRALHDAENSVETIFFAGTPAGDIFSFGIVMYQILLRVTPYDSQEAMPTEIIDKLISGAGDSIRPSVPTILDENEASTELIKLMQKCWCDNPSDRLGVSEIKAELTQLMKSFSGDIVEHMMKMMELYAANLEGVIKERTSQLEEQKQRSDNLLAAMLPKSVADVLKCGGNVEPEWYHSVTIYFSDIVGFTELSSQSTPLEIVDMLNSLYSTFDQIITGYDAYKVETIGDAYMVASGVPVRNGENHVGEIADLALAMCQNAKTFKIPHRPQWELHIRIGIHTGPVAAGVVGLTMPRYCLFGDTVNVASRMESTSAGMKIQVSWAAYDLLNERGRYLLSERGQVEIKGKGVVSTYWLVGKK